MIFGEVGNFHVYNKDMKENEEVKRMISLSLGLATDLTGLVSALLNALAGILGGLL